MNPYLAWPKSAKVAIVLFMVIAGGFILIAAKSILIPIALAVLIAFSLHPLVKRLTRWGVNRIASVVLVVATASICVAGLGYIVSHQLKSFADELPLHEANIERKVMTVKSMFKGGTLDKLTSLINRVNRRTEQRLTKGEERPQAPGEPSTQTAPEFSSGIAAAGRHVLESKRADGATDPPGAAPAQAPANAVPASTTPSLGPSLLDNPLVSFDRVPRDVGRRHPAGHVLPHSAVGYPRPHCQCRRAGSPRDNN